ARSLRLNVDIAVNCTLISSERRASSAYRLALSCIPSAVAQARLHVAHRQFEARSACCKDAKGSDVFISGVMRPQLWRSGSSAQAAARMAAGLARRAEI